MTERHKRATRSVRLREQGLKRCFSCEEIKAVQAFNQERARSDGLSPRCKPCLKAARLERLAREPDWEKNRSSAAREIRSEKINADARARYAKSPEKDRERKRRLRIEDPEKAASYGKKWRANNPDKARQSVAQSKRKNPDGVRVSGAAYRATNEAKIKAKNAAYRIAKAEEIRFKSAAYTKANPEKANANCAARQARKLRATPLWANRAKIVEIYAQAVRLTRETGIPHHVDHEIPLRGKNVCGLHVETNLRVIPALENRRKSNRF